MNYSSGHDESIERVRSITTMGRSEKFTKVDVYVGPQVRTIPVCTTRDQVKKQYSAKINESNSISRNIQNKLKFAHNIHKTI